MSGAIGGRALPRPLPNNLTERRQLVGTLKNLRASPDEVFALAARHLLPIGFAAFMQESEGHRAFLHDRADTETKLLRLRIGEARDHLQRAMKEHYRTGHPTLDDLIGVVAQAKETARIEYQRAMTRHFAEYTVRLQKLFAEIALSHAHAAGTNEATLTKHVWEDTHAFRGIEAP